MHHDPTSVLKIHDIRVKIDALKFAIHDWNHDVLHKTVRPLATELIKKQIQKALRDALQTGLAYIDGELVAVRDRMGAAKEGDKGKGEMLKQVRAPYLSRLSAAHRA